MWQSEEVDSWPTAGIPKLLVANYLRFLQVVRYENEARGTRILGGQFHGFSSPKVGRMYNAGISFLVRFAEKMNSAEH